MRTTGLFVLLLAGAAACSGDEPPACDPSQPGLRFVVHLPVEANPPGELGVQYANGAVERFDASIPPGPWSDPLVVCVPYGPDAVDGPATASFSSRPDPYRGANTTFVVDRTRRVDVDLTLEVAGDAGP